MDNPVPPIHLYFNDDNILKWFSLLIHLPQLTEWRFLIQLNTKYVILVTFLPAILSASNENTYHS